MIIAEGHRQMSEVGFARFSAREVAKRIGYSIGTLYNVMGNYDQMIMAINGRTLDLWIAYLERRLEGESEHRLRQAIAAYFEFAIEHRHAWTALFDFHLADDEETPEDYQQKVTAITQVIVRELAAALPPEHAEQAYPLARSLLATVHGHCTFALNRTFKNIGESDPLAAALDRVNDALARFGPQPSTKVTPKVTV